LLFERVRNLIFEIGIPSASLGLGRGGAFVFNLGENIDGAGVMGVYPSSLGEGGGTSTFFV
jgi:hypothetical protein